MPTAPTQATSKTSTEVLRALLRNSGEDLRVVHHAEHSEQVEYRVLAVTHDKDGPTLVIGPDPRTVDQPSLFES